MTFLEQQHQKNSNCDWAGGLPINIMDDVLDRLVDLSDYIRFASVCVPWRSVALDDRNHRPKKNNECPQIPMLMLKASKDNKAEIYSLTHEKILNFQLRVRHFSSIVGSSFGWHIYLENSNTSATVKLFNPFSDSTVELPLILKSEVTMNSNQFNDLHCIVKASLSKDPILYPYEYVVLLIHGEAGNLIFIKPGREQRWQLLPTERGGFCDAIYSKSRHLFFGVQRMGEVFSIDIDKGVDSFTPALQIRGGDGAFDDYDLRYIVETPGGDLLQVYRCLSSPTGFGNFHTEEIKVFKFLKSECSWSELKDLGDTSLFVGHGLSMCVLASNFLGFRRGSVYYSLPYKKSCLTAFRRYPDMGVANIATKQIERFNLKYPTDFSSLFSLTVTYPPVWIVPTYRDQARKALPT